MLTLEYARDAAQAELDLAQIRRVKVALIERMSAFGEFRARGFDLEREIKRLLKRAGSGQIERSDTRQTSASYARSRAGTLSGSGVSRFARTAQA